MIIGKGVFVNPSVHPTEDFDLPTHPLTEVRGKSPQENAQILRDILEGRVSDSSPIVDFILLNTAPLLVLSGVASSYREGVKLARESIKSGAALRELDAFRAMAKEASRETSSPIA
ncbi:glycosyl transferase [Piptocephalis cylindrospora]|uniref:Glycosyl transferase n=1 Tax=Piptocephalis cylindrospora TaxID=1907219 RepID=A0A4P9Y6J3_9FUNG|nr:glycosyl transferase [Piptocephalis cylindrospora]|eukprot:RKP14635.1 glycosyl transferase [Piptocephalis cylindrospora]